jgi:hypothetical protein
MRQQQRRAAGRRYQASEPGRKNHGQRQRPYRQRQYRPRVTHQDPASVTPRPRPNWPVSPDVPSAVTRILGSSRSTGSRAVAETTATLAGRPPPRFLRFYMTANVPFDLRRGVGRFWRVLAGFLCGGCFTVRSGEWPGSPEGDSGPRSWPYRWRNTVRVRWFMHRFGTPAGA